MNLACFEQTVQNSLARKYLSYSLWCECCRVAAIQATWSRHLTVDWTPLFSTHLEKTSAVITTESWGEKKQKQQNTKKPKSVFENWG